MNGESFDNLAEDDRKLVANYLKQIDLNDNNLYLSYGVSVQKQSQLITSRLKYVSESDENEKVINMVNQLNEKLLDYDKAKRRKKGIFGFMMKDVESEGRNYRDEAENIIKELENYKMILVRREVLLEKLKEDNKDVYEKMNLLIIAGKEKINENDNATDITVIDTIERFDKRINEIHKSNILNFQQEAQINYLLSATIELQDRITNNIANIKEMLENI